MRFALALALPLMACGEFRDRPATPGAGATLEVPGENALPALLPLAPSHVRAVGRVAMCTGTLVAPRNVLTARHCHIRTTDAFCAGENEVGVSICVSIA